MRLADRAGVKVPDVAWVSEEAWLTRANQSLLLVAPTICIEVMSPSNSQAEMADKAALYFAHVAREVWILEEAGLVLFYDPRGSIARSAIVPDFPSALERR